MGYKGIGWIAPVAALLIVVADVDQEECGLRYGEGKDVVVLSASTEVASVQG